MVDHDLYGVSPRFRNQCCANKICAKNIIERKFFYNVEIQMAHQFHLTCKKESWSDTEWSFFIN